MYQNKYGKMTKDNEKKIGKILRKVTKTVLSILIMLVVIFGSAGTLFWMEAWILIFLFLLYVTFFALWLRKINPELLKERTSRKNEGKHWDKIILSIYTLLLFCMLIVCGFDAVRFEWTQMPFVLKLIGFVGYIPAVILVFLTAKENAYLSEVVRIQDDRSHQVVKTGLYKYIRHPMYLAVIIFVVSTPLALGSFFGLFFSGLIGIIFMIRTHLEEKTLQKELAGYEEYMKEVKYRLFPGIW